MAGRHRTRAGRRDSGDGTVNPLWGKAPFLLFRFPSILVAVVGAAFVVAVASASSALFVSSAANASMQLSARSGSRWAGGLTVVQYGSLSKDSPTAPDPAAQADQRDRALTAATGSLGHLGPRTFTVSANQVQALQEGRTTTVTPLTRTGSFGHVQRVQGNGEGVWIALTTARRLGLEPGEKITLARDTRTISLRVGAIYRDLSDLPRAEFWEPLFPMIYARGDAPPPPAFLLADRDTMFRLGGALGLSGQYRWEFPLEARGLTLEGATELSNSLQIIEAHLDDPSAELSSQFAFPTHSTNLPGLVQRAVNTVAALRGPVDLLALAGQLLGLVVIAAAGVFVLGRRRIEVALLTARGMGPAAIGLKGAAETAIPAAVGAAAGWAAVVWLVKAFGPTSAISSQAYPAGIRSVVLTTLAGVALFGIVAGIAARRESEVRPSRALASASRTPWEAIVLALAAASFYEVALRSGSPVATSAGAPRVDVFLLLFPILFIAGVAGLATRGLRRVLPRLRAAGGRSSPPVYLATRRLAGAPRLSLLLVTASALAIGILAYAGVLVSSVRSTSEAKALVFTGSDVVVPLPPHPRIPKTTFPTTVVARFPEALTQPAQQAVTVLAIDPSTFAAAAHWDESFGGGPIEPLMEALRRSGSRVPVVVAGGTLPEDVTLEVGTGHAPLHVARTLEAFPGMLASQPMIVANGDLLSKGFTQADPSAGPVVGDQELWARGDPRTILDALSKGRLPVDAAITAEQVGRTPGFLSLSWTFAFLQALGILAGLVTLVGLVLYLQARQRSRLVAYALAVRMGLRKGAHRLSVALELGGMLVASFVLGAVLAAGAARLVYKKLDLIPGIPPAPLFRVPGALLAITAAVLAVAAIVGAWWVQRRTDRANVAEVMRLAG